MSRLLSVSATLALLLSLAGHAQSPGKSALDKATLEAYVRHLYVMGPTVTVVISDPKPSTDLPGFLDVTVHASMGNQSQDFPLLISKDGSKILQGTVFDVSHNPFKNDLDKLKTEFSPSFGTPGAPVVIVEFSDFECPYCKEEASMLRTNLPTSYPKEVRLYFKEFPLESIHPWSKAAAVAGRCVFRQNAGAFWNYHDWIFAHQTDITAENLKAKVMEWANGHQDTIDALKLGQCMDTKATEAEVNRTVAQAREMAVNATPTLFINGRRLAQAIDWPSLRAIIDYEIEYQKTAKNAGEDCGCDLKLNVPGMPQPNAFPAVAPKKK